MLDVLGFGGYEVKLHEKHAIGDGRINHPEITREDWLNVPEWLDNPALVLRQVDGKGFETGQVTFFTGEFRDGKPIIGLNPQTETGTDHRQLTLTMYASEIKNAYNLLMRGEWLYQNKVDSIGILSLLTSDQSQLAFTKGNGVGGVGGSQTLLSQAQVKELKQLFAAKRVNKDIKSESNLKVYKDNLDITDSAYITMGKAKAMLESLVGKVLTSSTKGEVGVTGLFSLTSRL